MSAKVMPIRHPPREWPPQATPDTQGWWWDDQGQCWQPPPSVWPPQLPPGPGLPPWPFPPFGPHPPHHCAPCPPPPCPPPPCPPLKPPGCADQIAKANQCWDQTQQLVDFLTQVIEDIFAQNPGIIPPPPASGGSGPLLGVTDGSKAAPGIVGEVIVLTTQIPYAAYPAITEPVVTLGVITPGDWDMFASMEFAGGAAGAIGGASFALNGPSGVSSDMNGIVIFGVTQGQAEAGATIIGQKGSASWAAATLIQFQVVVNQSTDATLPAGTATFRFEARRMR